MKYHKLTAGEMTGTYVMESPVTEADILQMAKQLAMSRLSKGRALTEPKQVSATFKHCCDTTNTKSLHCYCSTPSTGLLVSGSYLEARWMVPAFIQGK